MPPSSNSFLPICCCMKSSPPRRNKLALAENGELKHNLAIPRIKISPPQAQTEKTHHHHHEMANGHAQNGHFTGKNMHNGQNEASSICPRIEEIQCEIPDDDFGTARTHRIEEVKQLSMAELIHQVRLEEKLTARGASPPLSPHEFYSNLATIPEQNPSIEISTVCRPQSAAPQPNSPRPMRAVFNDEGDISARTQETSNPVEATKQQRTQVDARNMGSANGRYIRRSGRPISISPVVFIPCETDQAVLEVRQPAQSSAIRRYIATAPQMVISVITVLYTWMAGLIAIFGRQLFR